MFQPGNLVIDVVTGFPAFIVRRDCGGFVIAFQKNRQEVWRSEAELRKVAISFEIVV